MRSAIISDKVFDVANAVYIEMLKFRQVSMKENRILGFYFDIEKNEYIVFEDLDKNNIYNEVDLVLKKELIKDISSKVILSDLFKNINHYLKDNTFIFYPNASCLTLEDDTNSSVFFIYDKDAKEKEYARMIRLKMDLMTCELKISKVLSVNDKTIEFEN